MDARPHISISYSSLPLKYFFDRKNMAERLRLVGEELDYCEDMGQHPLVYQVHTLVLPEPGKLRDFVSDKVNYGEFVKYAQINFRAHPRDIDAIIDGDAGEYEDIPPRVVVADLVAMTAFFMGWRSMANRTKHMELDELYARWYTIVEGL